MGSKLVIYALIALIAGVGIGFGFRTPIANVLNLNASDVPNIILIKSNDCPDGKIWTGNGCADTKTWTNADWYYFYQCLKNGGTEATCAKQTEIGKGRK